MKFAYKILLLLSVLTAVAFILFYPVDNKSNFHGSWEVAEIRINGRVVPMRANVTIQDDGIEVRDGSDFLLHDRSVFKTVDDSISLSFKKNKLFNGAYKISMATKIIGGGKGACYDYRLHLVTKNKTITLFRQEPVQWENGVSRGRP